MDYEISNLSHLLLGLESCVELGLDKKLVDTFELEWKVYNPRKPISRWGASITSLDGSQTGIPDLDSLREYNLLQNTNFVESSFRTLTPQGKAFHFLQDFFDLGRSHFIKLGPGGYFPYHRDSDPDTFRILYCLNGCHYTNLVWIQNDQVLRLSDQHWYFINTLQKHAVFSFNECEFAVFNVLKTKKSLQSLFRFMTVR